MKPDELHTLAELAKAHGLRALRVRFHGDGSIADCAIETHAPPATESAWAQPAGATMDPRELAFLAKKQELELMYGHTGATVRDEEVWNALGVQPRGIGGDS